MRGTRQRRVLTDVSCRDLACAIDLFIQPDHFSGLQRDFYIEIGTGVGIRGDLIRVGVIEGMTVAEVESPAIEIDGNFIDVLPGTLGVGNRAEMLLRKLEVQIRLLVNGNHRKDLLLEDKRGVRIRHADLPESRVNVNLVCA